MKKTILIVLLLIANVFSYGTNNIPERNRRFISNNPSVGFIENKGQFTDNKGNAVPFVLFKTSVNSTDIYITTYGITYVLLKEEEEDKELDKSSNNKHENLQSVIFPYMLKKDDKAKFTEWCRVDMELTGASVKKENIETFYAVKGHYNYFLEHCPDGITNVMIYRKILVKSIYPGIDWVLYIGSDGNSLKYDFIIHPGANPDDIRINYKGDVQVESGNGEYILLKTSLGDVKEGKLSCFQYDNKKINSLYKVQGNQVQFHVENYDTSQTLIIDPPVQLLNLSTYFGSTGFDGPKAITSDNSGSAIVTGYTTSSSFPTYDPGNGVYYNGSNNGDMLVFISKFDSLGVLCWSTFYTSGKPLDITTDEYNNIYVFGWTTSYAMPTLPLTGAYNQATHAGGGSDLFILKFSSSGTRLWATYFGGNNQDFYLDNGGCGLGGITVDYKGNIYITGATASTNFPLMNPAGSFLQPAFSDTSDVFISKFNSSGALVWSTYYGGKGLDNGNSIATDLLGNVYVVGNTNSADFPLQNMPGCYNQTNYGGGSYFWGDVFILKFDSLGARKWATFYGGSKNEDGFDVATDIFNNVYIVGGTWSVNFPLKNLPGAYNQTYKGSVQGYIIKIASSGAHQWTTYFGGNMGQYVTSVGTDKDGNLYIAGDAGSNLPVLNPGKGAFYQSKNAGSYDVFIAQFDLAGVLSWSTYFGGSGMEWASDMAVDKKAGCVFVTGETVSPTTNMPTCDAGNGAYFQANHSSGEIDDGYVLKLCPKCYLSIVKQPDDQSVCVGDSVTFNLSVVSINGLGSDTKNYQWLFNGNPITGATDSFYTINPVKDTSAGSYSCVIVDSCTSDTSNTAILTVFALPDIDLGNDTLLCDGQVRTLSSKTNGIFYKWQDGSTNSFYVATTDGLYWVEVTDSNGCKNTDDIKLFPCPPEINVPNVFTPNDDGTNDEFYPDAENIKELKMVIFNRWGRIVFETTNIHERWDGTDDGKPCADGVYYWVITYKGKEDSEKDMQGTVTLIR